MGKPQKQMYPNVKWDGKEFFVSLPVDDGRNIIEAKWQPAITYIVRIREVGSDEWSLGFETPLTSCSFSGLKPDTEYEAQLRVKNAAGISEPTQAKARTTQQGDITDGFQFPPSGMIH